MSFIRKKINYNYNIIAKSKILRFYVGGLVMLFTYRLVFSVVLTTL